MKRRFLVGRGAAVLVGELLMTWPALYNGYPLRYPDSMSYLEDGGLVARALFLRKFSADYGGRSFIYCLGILPFHWNVTPWPIVALQALLTASSGSSCGQSCRGKPRCITWFSSCC